MSILRLISLMGVASLSAMAMPWSLPTFTDNAFISILTDCGSNTPISISPVSGLGTVTPGSTVSYSFTATTNQTIAAGDVHQVQMSLNPAATSEFPSLATVIPTDITNGLSYLGTLVPGITYPGIDWSIALRPGLPEVIYSVTATGLAADNSQLFCFTIELYPFYNP